jgi:hypothetical protein
LAAAALLAEAAWATPPLTTVQDQLFRANGTPVNGTLIVSWPAFTASDNSNIPANVMRVNISGGILRVQLVPTTTALTTARYTVQYLIDGQLNNSEIWNVPASSTPVTVAMVRVTPSASSSSGTSGTSANDTSSPIAIADVTGLSDALTARPTKGAAYLPGRLLTPDVNGNLAGVAGTADQCVRGDGSLGACGITVSFIDLETPGGTLDGVNAAFTLSQSPNPAASLLLFRNGLLQKQNGDYTLAGAAVTFAAGSVPQPGDLVQASYRVAQ